MSPLWRAELRLGLCPDRLVLPDAIHPVAGDAIEEMKVLTGRARIAVVLSNHFVRYVVLPPTNVLKSEEDWNSYAQDTFTETYGAAAAGWRIRLCCTGRNQPRVASAIEASLLDSLRTIPGLVSVQPYLMAAFNARRRALRGQTAWFVLHEPGRFVLCLFTKGNWKLVRTRQAHCDWPASLADILDRELAGFDEIECDQAMVCSEETAPGELGRYRITDISIAPGAAASRPHLMVLD